MEQLIRDVGYGLRGLWRDRTFAFTTVATLAVALALVTVVFAIFNVLLVGAATLMRNGSAIGSTDLETRKRGQSPFCKTDGAAKR
jgi:hypothetical protein